MTVRVHCPPNSPAHRLLESHGRTWARDNGATLELIENGEADIDVIAPVDLPNLAAHKAIQQLPDASITAGFLGLYRARLLTWDTATYALPLLGDALVCLYRADLFGDKASQAPSTSSITTILRRRRLGMNSSCKRSSSPSGARSRACRP